MSKFVKFFAVVVVIVMMTVGVYSSQTPVAQGQDDQGQLGNLFWFEMSGQGVYSLVGSEGTYATESLSTQIAMQDGRIVRANTLTGEVTVNDVVLGLPSGSYNFPALSADGDVLALHGPNPGSVTVVKFNDGTIEPFALEADLYSPLVLNADGSALLYINATSLMMLETGFGGIYEFFNFGNADLKPTSYAWSPSGSIAWTSPGGLWINSQVTYEGPAYQVVWVDDSHLVFSFQEYSAGAKENFHLGWVDLNSPNFFKIGSFENWLPSKLDSCQGSLVYNLMPAVASDGVGYSYIYLYDFNLGKIDLVDEGEVFSPFFNCPQ